MRQAIHIFKKDVRNLRFEIAGVLALTLASAIADVWVTRVTISDQADALHLLPAAWSFLIARVIHAEAIPGDRQFWLTRPYDRRSLWAAKTLFVVAFINLPMLVAQAAILSATGLPVGGNLGGLLWAQVPLSALLVLPAAALAAVTTSPAQFSLGVIAIIVSVTLRTQHQDYLRTVEWIPGYAAVAVVVLLQRGPFPSVLASSDGSVTRIAGRGRNRAGNALIAYAAVPWTSAFAIQSKLEPFRGSLTISFDQKRAPQQLPQVYTGANRVRVDLPLLVTGADMNRMRRDAAILQDRNRRDTPWSLGYSRN